MDYIQLKERDVFKIGIRDVNGNAKKDENGNELCIIFDLEDIETPANYSKCVYKAEKAQDILVQKLAVIEKQQDSKGRGIMTKNEEDKYNALREYYKNVEEALDMFLGKGGTEKIFGKVRYLTMFQDFVDMMKPIMPKLKINSESIQEQIRKKYSQKSESIIKDE